GNHDAPFNENMIPRPNTSYALQKVFIEYLLSFYNHAYGLNFNVVRLSNPYGKYQNPKGNVGVITKFIYQILNNDVINIYGDGSTIKDFIYIDDAIKGIINIAFSDTKHNIFNLGSGYGISILEIVESLKSEFMKDLNVQF